MRLEIKTRSHWHFQKQMGTTKQKERHSLIYSPRLKVIRSVKLKRPGGRGTICSLFCAPGTLPAMIDINPQRHALKDLTARVDALRGYL